MPDKLTGRVGGRVGVQQRVLPEYRAPFFDALASACPGGLSIFAGQPRPDESILLADHFTNARHFSAGNLHIVSANSPFYLCWQAGIHKWLNEWQPQILIVETNPRILSTRLAVHWMHARGRKVIGWGLGIPQSQQKNRWDAFLRSKPRFSLLSSFDALIAYSERGAAEFRAFGFPAERVFVAPNAVAARPCNPLPEKTLDETGHLTVLFVGRLQSRKRVDLLLKACAALPTVLQPHLVIVGDGPERQELTKFAKSIYPQAEFAGSRRGKELESFFYSADLFVLPGTGGLAVQQAMSYGLPVVVAESDGTQVNLVRPENGVQISPGDLPGLIEALQTLLSDIPHLRAMGKESYRIVADEVNVENMVSVFVQALEKVSS